MSPTRQMIKAAVDSLSEKVAVVPVQGGQIPPPQGTVSPPMPPGGDPGMGAPPGGPGMPPGPPGAPPGMPPGMDPSMMGGMPPGAPPMDPSMMGPPPGPEGAPMDPSMMGPPPGPEGAPEGAPEEDAASAQNTETAQQSGDVLVPVKAMTEMVTKVIEATKGKRTADPKDPNSMAPGGEAPPGQGPLPGMDPGVANIGGAPADQAMAMPGMAPPGGAPPPKMGSANLAGVQSVVDRIAKARGHR